MPDDDKVRPSEARRQPVLAVGLILWLGAYWFWSDATLHRWALFLLVLPGLLVNLSMLREEMRGQRWVGFLVLLLIYQWLSRFWSDGGGEVVSEGYWLDVLMMFVLVGGMLAVANSHLVKEWIVPALGIIAALASLYSLLVFYSEPGRSVADDRLRNMLVYEHGLNPVLTGLLCAFGLLVVIGQVTEQHRWRWCWFGALVVVLLGLLATQSRGAILAIGFGGLVFLLFKRGKAVPALLVCAGTTLAFFGVLLWVQSGGEAAKDLIGRGATGRFDIYAWFLGQMNGLDGLIGKGMEHSSSIPEEEFGWFVEHPHSIYVTQFYLTGGIGTGLMLLLIVLALQAAWKLACRGEVLWLALLGGFGMALIFDGSHVFSLFSNGRIEPLLILLPAVFALGREARIEEGLGKVP